MKLYAFQPRGHGDKSYFVLAESEDEARKAVRKKMRSLVKQMFGISRLELEAFDTDYYKVTVADDGVVILNDND